MIVLNVTLVDQDSGLNGIRLNLKDEQLLFTSMHTLPYRDRQTDIHTYTPYIFMFSLNLTLYPGLL